MTQQAANLLGAIGHASEHLSGRAALSTRTKGEPEPSRGHAWRRLLMHRRGVTRKCVIGLVGMTLAALLYLLCFLAVRAARDVRAPNYIATPRDVTVMFGPR